MDGADWLRDQLTTLGCASCGRRYLVDQIDVLAQREGLFFVDLGCDSCGLQAIAVVTLEHHSERGDPRAATGEFDEIMAQRTTGAEPVSEDDLLAMHEFLRGFDGDFARLFGSASGPWGP